MLKDSFKIYSLALLGSLLLRLINFTLRWTRLGLDGENANWVEGNSRILAFWHGRQLFMPWIYIGAWQGAAAKKRINALISRHSDGRIIAEAVQRLGINSVAGSSTRGGGAGLKELVRRLKAGEHAGITPDGPRGPIYKVKAGAIRMAQQSGVPIYPTAFSAEKCWQLGSWDKMIIPKPFSRAIIIMGEAIKIPAELSEEEYKTYRDRVEKEINKITKRADSYFLGTTKTG